MTGQINIDSNAGRLIYNISLCADIFNIVEIGTWNGMGSTKCVIEALKNRAKKANFISIELYPEMYKCAIANLASDLEYVKILNGSIVSEIDLEWLDTSLIDFQNDLHAQLYYHQDIEYIKTSKNILDQIPESIDFLILDGGEYSTYPEWQKLKDRTSIVFLDDTAILKCSRIRHEILESSEFEIIKDDLGDRNGYSAFIRKNHIAKFKLNF
jgi:hypothetical protein